MKTLNSTSISALALTALLIAGSASAASITDINSSVNTASAMLTVDGDVAILTGSVDTLYEKETLARAAQNLEGIDEVINNLRF